MNIILLLYVFSNAIYYSIFWKRSIARNDKLTEEETVFLLHWGKVTAVFHFVAFLILASLVFMREAFVMGILAVLVGLYSSVLLSWFCKKQRKNKGLFYGALVAGIFLVAIGIFLVVLSVYE